MKKKNNRLIYIITGVVVLIIFLIIGKKSGWIGKDEKAKVSTEKVSLKTITEVVSANGKVNPEVEVKISSDVSGEIVELPVKEGQSVKKGDLLVKINPKIYITTVEREEAALNGMMANLANSRAGLVQAKSQYDKANATYVRSKKLYDETAISASDFEAAKSAYEVAEAGVEAANQNVVSAEFNVKSTEASLNEARENLRKTTIFAPVSGTISKLNVELGERIVGMAQMTGTEMMRIANLNEMEVRVDVNENDIVRVHFNDTSLIDVDAYLNRKFKGVVTEIGNSANTQGTNTDQVTNFTVKIRILRESYMDLLANAKNNGSPFRPGMSATVDIQTKTVRNVLAIPVQSVTTRDSSASKKSKEITSNANNANSQSNKKVGKVDEPAVNEYVFAVSEGKVKQVKIKTGIQDNNFIQIVNGLENKAEVVNGPYSAISKTLKDGDAVQVVAKEKLFENTSK